MGYVFRRVTKAGRVRHTGMYYDLTGRPRSAGTFDTAEQARDAWRDAERELYAGRSGDPKRGRQTLRRYVDDDWFPHHVIELSTREGYRYILDAYILPELGDQRIIQILAGDVREWITRLQDVYELNPPSIRNCKVVLDAILTTALNDRIVPWHAGKGVKTPTVSKKPRRVITAKQFDAVYDAVGARAEEVGVETDVQLLTETNIESGLRWGELTELRPKDIDVETGLLTVARTVVELKSKNRPDGIRFIVKDYPKDGDWRQFRLPKHLVKKIAAHIAKQGLGPDDLIFEFLQPTEPSRRGRPALLPEPETLGWTEPNDKGRQYRHGTKTAYQAAKCKCQHCRNAMSAYRATRRASGLDSPRKVRRVDTDGHIPNSWFRTQIWNPALVMAGVPFRVTPHGMRHAHASWLLAGGADLQVVKERLGHGSITTTEQYLHTLPTADEQALAALDAYRGAKAKATKSATPPRKKKPKKRTRKLKDQHLEELAEMRRTLADVKTLVESIGDSA